MPKRPVKIFYSYAHEDSELLNGLQKQLRSLQRREIISEWHDREILAGTEWSKDISRHLEEAEIILLLVSPDFIDSDYCWGVEVTRAMERHQNGTARVIPVILRSCQWTELPFGKLQALPAYARPVRNWGNRDEAFLNIASGIEAVANVLRGTA